MATDPAQKEAGMTSAGSPIDKEDSNAAQELYRSITAGSISPQLFERLYLSPQNQIKGDLRKTFGNPTPLAVMGFSVALTPLSIAFMTWRSSGGNGVATGTASVWFGGLLLLISGLLEFILGNTFPFMVFMGYGCHFLTYATLFMPQFNSIGYFSGTKTATGPTTAAAGLDPTFAASFAYYALSLCILSLIFLICSLRTNAIFVVLFLFATTGFGLATGAFFHLSAGDTALGTQLVIGTGACFFGASCMGWYLLCSIMFGIMELPIPTLPVFDLSTVIKAKKPTT